MNFKNLVFITVISTFFSGCSGCSEDSIPDGSGSRSSLNLNSNQPKNETAEETEARVEAEEYSEEVTERAVSEMNNLYDKLREKSRSEKVHEERVENDSNDNDFNEEPEVISNNDEVRNNEPVEQKRIDNTPNSWESLTSQVEKRIEERRESYATPPKPANLSIYDDIDPSTVYESNGKPTSSALGEFPPMPPMMMLQKP
jgi:hypothetical protein